jgi:dimethylargininase
VLLALTRAVSPRIVDCELTHLAREPIDHARTEAELSAYERQLSELGATVRRIAPEPALPDSVFVEDTAVVFDELAVITRPGAESRRAETPSVADALASYRRTVAIEAPGTLDGGDVLVVGREVFVGRSSRTNQQGFDQMQRLLGPHGYTVRQIAVKGCLHLKSAVTRVAERVLLVNPDWIPADAFPGYRTVSVDPAEPSAANALALGGTILHPSHHARTRARLTAEGLSVTPVAMVELAKAEAGVTCCSLIFKVP